MTRPADTRRGKMPSERAERIPPEPLAPLWARIAAWAAALSPVPSALYRLTMVLGGRAGLPPTYAENYPLFVAYTSALSLVSCACAFLTLGLVSEWSRRFPAWMPRVGGRALDPRRVFLAAVAGAVCASLLAGYVMHGLLGRFEGGPPDLVAHLQRHHGWVLLCYLPLVLWGPLLFLVALDFRRRRLRGRPQG